MKDEIDYFVPKPSNILGERFCNIYVGVALTQGLQYPFPRINTMVKNVIVIACEHPILIFRPLHYSRNFNFDISLKPHKGFKKTITK
jgi:hypothetical protein